MCRQLVVGKSAASNVLHRFRESCRRAHLVSERILPIVESESLFINIAKKVIRLYGDVRSGQSALKQTPEILDSLSVNSSINLGGKMVHDLVQESFSTP